MCETVYGPRPHKARVHNGVSRLLKTELQSNTSNEFVHVSGHCCHPTGCWLRFRASNVLHHALLQHCYINHQSASTIGLSNNKGVEQYIGNDNWLNPDHQTPRHAKAARRQCEKWDLDISKTQTASVSSYRTRLESSFCEHRSPFRTRCCFRCKIRHSTYAVLCPLDAYRLLTVAK